MKNERLLEIIGDIDSEFILEAEPKTLAPQKNCFARYAAMAAGFIALFIIGNAVMKNTLNTPQMQPETGGAQLAATADNDEDSGEDTNKRQAKTSGVQSYGSDINSVAGSYENSAESEEAAVCEEAAECEDAAEFDEEAAVDYPVYYLNDTKYLELTENDPARERILTLLKAFENKPEADKNEFDHAPALTVIEADGTVREYGDSVTVYSQPASEDAENIPDKVSYYERTTDKNGKVTIRYFEADADVGEFRKLVHEAAEYENKRLESTDSAEQTNE
ncbi:MAG: hypothetical protein IJR45_08280 [Firmicutes bacterium]|nr:hypothetical protein [Bacillota bacterium]